MLLSTLASPETEQDVEDEAEFPESPEVPETIEQRFVVEGECHGWRLDRFLQKKIRRLSRNRIHRVIRGECWVAGNQAKPSMRVWTGQEVWFRRPAPKEPEVPREITVVHEDPCFYVIDKPAGLPIHPTARYHHSTLTAVLRERFAGETLQVAHRLDRETSGLLLIARTKEAAVILKGGFARRTIKKRYLAIVHGVVSQEEQRIEAPIGPSGGIVRVRMAVRSEEEGGQRATTVVRVLRRLKHHTLVACFPETGRQHQIRVHLDHIGHPIVGDKLYPDEEIFLTWAEEGFAKVADRLPLARHALHATYLGFAHPASGDWVEVESPLPRDLADYLVEE